MPWIDYERGPVRVGVEVELRSSVERLKWVLVESPSADPLWRLVAALD